MDFKNPSDVRSRSSARTLMTCPICVQYFDDPRLLPCGHTFCRRCLQKHFEQKQSSSLIRVGRINCPKCKTMIGIPVSGVDGFPVDKKIGRIKDLVINELAEDISKNYHSHGGYSDTQSSHSDRTGSGDVGDGDDNTSSKRYDFTRSRSRYTRSDAMNDGSDKSASNSGFSTNSAYPDIHAKYAKYFVKDDETSSSEGYKPHFRPAVRAERTERHRVGYSSSFQHRRRRLNVEQPKGFDDSSDLFRHSKYGSSPHIGRGSSSTVSSSYSDIFEQVPQSTEDLTSSRNLGSRISADYDAARERRYPGPSSTFPGDDFGDATASMPSLSRTRDETASGVDPGVLYSALRNTFSEPKFGRSPGVEKTDAAASNGSDASSKKSFKVPGETRQRSSVEINVPSESTNDRNHDIPHMSYAEQDSTQYRSNANEKPKTSLPTHRENIVTSSADDNERSSQKTNFREGLRSRSRTAPRPHSDYYSDKTATFPHGETSPGPGFKEKFSADVGSSAGSFTPRSRLAGRSRTQRGSDSLYTECQAEEYQGKTSLKKEKVQSWYQDFPESKKFDENFTRTKPDDINASQNFPAKESPTFHKSASFSTNYWQEKSNRVEDNLKTGNYTPQSRRKTYYRNVNGSFSAGNLNQFDGPIKFEMKKRKKLRKKKKTTFLLNDQNEDDSKEEYESETEQRNAFNVRILNMRMNKYRYDNIMSDFKNGNLDSETNLNDDADDLDCTEDNVEALSEQSQSSTENDTARKTEDSSTDNVNNSEIKAENAAAASEKSDAAKEKPVPEEVGHQLKEMIDSMRAKYQAMDVDDQSPTTNSAVLQPSCCDIITPKWNFQKTEFVIPTAMAITSKGCAVVADYGNSCLEFFDADGNYEHKIDGIKPFSIVANRLDLIIVGDRKGKAIRVFDEYGGDVAQWEAGLFGWISGLAVLPNGNVVVHDRDRCKIGIYSSGGEKINEFASYGVQDSQLCMADFLTVDGKNRIIVADSGNHCLKLFATDGKFISKIAGRGTEDGCLKWPKGVCVDSADNIIVADSQNNRVSMFSSTGQFVQHLITTAPSPYGVCFSASTNLFGMTHYDLSGFSQYDVYQFLQ